MPQPFPHLPLARRGTLHRFEIDARSLHGNPWGDPVERELLVYTPHGFTEGTSLPAVLFLPAFAGTGEGLLGRGLGDVPLTTRLDHLFDQGAKPFVAVFPDSMTRLGGSQYVNSPGIGNYRSYILHDVMLAVEQRFQTRPRWGVAGRSSGGYGAMCLAMDAPDMFCAVVSHAGDLGFDLCYLGDLPLALAELRKDPLTFLGRFWATERPSHAQFAAFNVLAMACAYTPAPDATPFPCELPFDLDKGTIDFDVFARWRQHDPLVLVDDPVHQAALRAMELVFLDAGDRDEHGLHIGMERFVAKLDEHGIRHESQTFSGGHRGTAFRWEVSLPKLAAAVHAANP